MKPKSKPQQSSLPYQWDSPFPTRISPDLIKKWVVQYPTPFYVYDQETLENRIQEVKDFPHPSFSSFTPRYALKANPSRALVEILDRHQITFDASSAYEVERLLKIGIAPHKILLTSQQTPPEKRFLTLFRRGLLYNATSIKQLVWYGKICPRKNISLRINPGFGSGKNVKTTVGGEDSGFGIWHSYYPEILSLCRKYSLNVERIHTHVGSGSGPHTWEDVTLASLKQLQHFSTAQTINIGGGFRVARYPGDTFSNLHLIGSKVTRLMEEFSRKYSRIFDVEIEPGTYFVATAGLLIAQVEDVIKTGDSLSECTRFIKLNTGMNDLIRPTLYQSRHHIDILSKISRKSSLYPFIVIGHCCEGGDQISQSVSDGESVKTKLQFRMPSSGDPVIIHGVGAYGSAMSSRYNSYPFISEYLYHRKRLRLIRKAETLNDIMAKEISLKNKIGKKN